MNYRNIITITLFIIVSIAMPSTRVAALEDAIIAVVDDQLITLKDLKDYVTSVHTQLTMEGRHSEQELAEIMKRVEESALDRLIEDRLVLNAANELGIEVKRPAIDEKIDEIRARHDSEEQFVSMLASQGITISDLRDKLRDQLKAQFFVDHEIKSQITVNPQEITDFYHNNPEKFIMPERADLGSIFIPLGNDPEKTKKQINEAYALITSGSSFDDVAKQYSATPYIGVVPKGQMKADIDNQIFNLKTGEITDIIKSDQGYFIFKLKKLLPPRTMSLEQSKNQIAQFLFNEKMKDKMTSWFEKQKEKTYIEIKTP